MIRLTRTKLLNELNRAYDNIEGRSRIAIERDAVEGRGEIAIAYLIKRGYLNFPAKVLKDEINNMVEKSLINIEQWEQMINLLDNARNGEERVVQFLKRKRRIVIVK